MMTIYLRKTSHDEECMGIIALDNGDRLVAYGISDDDGIKEMCFIHINGSGEVIDNHLIGPNTMLTLPSDGHYKALAWGERYVENLDGHYVAIVLFEGRRLIEQ